MKKTNTGVTNDSGLNDKKEGSNINWGKLIMWIIIGIISMGVIKLLIDLFTTIGKGPIAKGLGDVLGAGANVVNGLTNNCTSQASCSSIVEQTGCEKQSTCSWNPPKDAAAVGKCLGNTGRKEGSGGFLSAQCGLGIAAILWICGSLLVSLIGTIVAALATRNANIELAGRLNGKGTAATLSEVVTAATEATENIIEKNKEKEGASEELTDADIQIVAAKAGNEISTREALEQTVKQPESNELSNQVVAEQARLDIVIQQKAEALEISKVRQDKLDKEVDFEVHNDNPEPFALRMFAEHNITPTPAVHLYLMNKTMKREKRGIIIPEHHKNYLQKFMYIHNIK